MARVLLRYFQARRFERCLGKPFNSDGGRHGDLVCSQTEPLILDNGRPD